jgi:hypothetical protein
VEKLVQAGARVVASTVAMTDLIDELAGKIPSKPGARRRSKGAAGGVDRDSGFMPRKSFQIAGLKKDQHVLGDPLRLRENLRFVEAAQTM